MRTVLRLVLLAAMAIACFTATASGAVAAECPNEAIREEQGSTYLSDCRGYEMVSPANKKGAEISYQTFLTAENPAPWQAAADGAAVEYTSAGAFAGTESGLVVNPYISRRTVTGWQTAGLGWPINPTPLDPPEYVYHTGYTAFSPDLSIGSISDAPAEGPLLAPGAAEGYPNLYLRDLGTHSYTALTTVAPPNFPPEPHSLSYMPLYQGASADFSHVIFAAPDALTPNAQVPCSGCENLYEWSEGGLRLVNVLPNGTATEDAGAGSHYYFDASKEGLLTHAISADGSKIYWTDKWIKAGNIYVRIDGQRTVPVGNGLFWAGSADGERAIYTSGPKEGQEEDLYEFDLGTEHVTDLTPGGEVLGVVGESEDLSYIYFVAKGVLAPGASAGESNLYLWHNGTISLVAVLPSTEGHASISASGISIDNVDAEERDSYVTPDGHYMTFTSAGRLTSYDNEGHLEAYYYDATTGKLACASCNQSGAPPQGKSGIIAWRTQFYAPRSVSDDGAHVFFDSTEALVPRDTNGQADVYEWEPEGVAGCTRSDGCVSLISGGTGGAVNPSELEFGNSLIGGAALNYFVDASANGNEVFFTTEQQLTREDGDQAGDLYDARVGGGFPVAEATTCSGDGCRQLSGALAPPSPVVGSASFSGARNLARAASKPTMTVLTHEGRGTHFAVDVEVSAPGRVRIAGAGIKDVSRELAKAGAQRLRVALTRRSARRLHLRRRLRLMLQVTYWPAGGGATLRSHVRLVVRSTRHHMRGRRARRASHDRGGAK